MKRMGSVLVLGGSLWLLGGETLQAEIVRCVGPDGTAVYTNAAGGLSECSRYESRSELGFVSGGGSVDQGPMRKTRYSKKEAASVSAPEKLAPSGTRALPREVSFETFRMLSTGMTKAEVLSRAGHPRHEFKNRGTQRWIYASTERWIVEVVFSGNHVIAIDWSRA